MSSVVEICNMALSHIGVRRIQSLTEATKEARTCNLLYEPLRDASLEDHDWGFARKNVVLAATSDSYTNWEYAYAWPSDCISARKIIDEDGSYTGTSYDIDNDRSVQVGKVKFEIGINDAKDGKIILTDKADAELRYTAKVTNSTLFSPIFVAALSLRLASDLVQPLRADASLQGLLLQQYQTILFRARSVDSNQGYEEPNNVNVFVRSRS